jgi:2-dehydropantoate 2-reductase
MNVYVVGAGAVGTFLGGLLRNAGANVTYAPRNHPDVTVVEADLAIVAVKSYDTEGAIETLQLALPDIGATTILCPQNGVGNEEKLAAAFGPDAIVAAALTTPVDRTRDGRSVAAHEGGLGIAPVGGQAHNWLIALFERTGLPIKVVSDYRALKWSKLSLNIVANASCAILNVLPDRLVQLDDIFALEIRAMRETRAVMNAMKLTPIDLPRYRVKALQGVVSLPSPLARVVLGHRVAGARGRKPPSLLLDLRAAKGQTEVDVLNGAVARTGRALGVKTPVNAVYCRILDDISHMPQLWAKYRERPETLLAEAEAEIARQNGPRVHA